MIQLFRTAMIALAATASLAGAAVAQDGFRYRDLDLTTAQGVQTLRNRIANAAARSCASEHATGTRTSGGSAACERDYRRAAMEALPQAAREQVRVTTNANALVSAR